MHLPHSDTRILLIGRGLRNIDLMIDTFQRVGAELLFADNTDEGLRAMCFERPHFVICDIGMPGSDAADLCRTIRSNSRLRNTPVVFAGESGKGIEAVFNALNAGADDYVTEFSNPDHFLAKLLWMMEQRSEESAQRRQFEALKERQRQTLEIVRETSGLFRGLANEDTSYGPYGVFDQRVEAGLGMICGLASILEEQISAVEGLFPKADEKDGHPPMNRFTTEPEVEQFDEFVEMALPL